MVMKTNRTVKEKPIFTNLLIFLISPKGEISYRWISVLPINHAKEVLNVLKKKI